MTFLRALPMRGLLVFSAATTVAVVLAMAAGSWLFAVKKNEQREHAYLAQAASADLMPPALYLSDAMRIASLIMDSEDADEQKLLRAGLERAIAGFRTREAFWRELQGGPHDAHAAIALGASTAEAHKVIDFIERSWLPALDSGNREKLEAAFGRMVVRFEAHEKAAVEGARLAREQAQQSSEAMLRLDRQENLYFLIALAVGVVLALGSALVTFRSVMGRLGAEPAVVSAAALRMSEGDFTVTLPEAARGSLVDSFVQMQQQLRELIGRMNQSASELAGQAQQLAASATQAEAMARAQAESIQSNAASVEQMSATSTAVANNAQAMRAAADQTDALVRRMMEHNAQVKESVGSLAQAISRAAALAAGISEVAQTTRILSLNASIEAARAGTAGRGFAVVAQEVGALANKVGDASREIEAAMQNLTGVSKDVIDRLQESDRMLAADETDDSVQAQVSRTRSLVQEVSGSIAEQSAALTLVGQQTERASEVVTQSQAAASEVSSAASSVAKMGASLQGMAAQFAV